MGGWAREVASPSWGRGATSVLRSWALPVLIRSGWQQCPSVSPARRGRGTSPGYQGVLQAAARAKEWDAFTGRSSTTVPCRLPDGQTVLRVSAETRRSPTWRAGAALGAAGHVSPVHADGGQSGCTRAPNSVACQDRKATPSKRPTARKHLCPCFLPAFAHSPMMPSPASPTTRTGPASDWVDPEGWKQWRAVLTRLRAVLAPPPPSIALFDVQL